jgi:hypothetical protein
MSQLEVVYCWLSSVEDAKMYLVIISSLSLSWVSKLKDGRFLMTNSEALLPLVNEFYATFW